jgi:hypothetical protein
MTFPYSSLTAILVPMLLIVGYIILRLALPEKKPGKVIDLDEHEEKIR